MISEQEPPVDLDAADRTARAGDPAPSGGPAPSGEQAPMSPDEPLANVPAAAADQKPDVRGAAEAAEPGGATDGDQVERALAEISVTVRELAGSAERYHDRAAQREGVIDYLRAELETLRRGERRGLLRPLLTEMCRLRNDLLRQAATLPQDYDADQAAKLLVSFAETVELALENNGVANYSAGEGEPFDPRRHRRLRGAESDDPAKAGRVAQPLRDGYLDIETDSPIVHAEVTVFMPVKESK